MVLARTNRTWEMTFLKYAFIIDMKENRQLQTNHFGWCKIVNPDYPKDFLTRRFVSFCIEKDILELTRTDFYKLSKDYDDKVRDIISTFADGKFIEFLEAYYYISEVPPVL